MEMKLIQRRAYGFRNFDNEAASSKISLKKQFVRPRNLTSVQCDWGWQDRLVYFAASSSQMRRYFRLACSSLSNLLPRRFKSTTHNAQKKEFKAKARTLFFYWLGWQDSNLRMSAPKADALPLGDTPI